MKYDIERLRKMTPQQRAQLHRNAMARREQGGQEILDLLLASGLPLRSGEGLRLDDPVYLEMEELIWSPRGQQAAVDAVGRGLPALAGVDPLLQILLGDRYGPHDLGTASAGSIVAEVMRARGYRETGPGKCPDGCVARTGMTWTPAHP